MTYEDYNIVIPYNNTSGQYKTLCPECSTNRRKRNDKCLSVNLDDGVWNCHHCGYKGSLNKKSETEVPITVPIEYEKSKIPKEVIKWFKERGISQSVLKSEQIGYKDDWISFPYYKESKVVNIKYRGRGKKFKQEYKSEKCFYGFDSLRVDADKIIICEGEMDVLSIIESNNQTLGILSNIISVPDGAPPPGSTPSDLKFSYLESAEEYLMSANKIILAVDNDAAGIKLQKELSRRIGREKCFTVEYPDGCKDMNDVLVKHNAEKVMEIINDPTPYPIDGIISISDVKSETIELLTKPEHLGLTTGYGHMDGTYRVSTGETTVITGVPNHGKSEFLDSLIINMIQLHLWNFAIFSAENRPVKYHLLKLLAKFVNKPFMGDNKLTDKEAETALDILDNKIKFIGTQEDNVTVESILDQCRILNYRYGINGLVIDPWNTVEHKYESGETETNYISRMLSKITAFAKLYDIHVWMIAHPRKMEISSTGKVSVPTLYDISGSANWYNKVDNGMTIHRHRNEDEDYVSLYVGKVRHQHKNGKPGVVDFSYNTNTGRYNEYNRSKETIFGESSRQDKWV
jgi:twinkle protein